MLESKDTNDSLNKLIDECLSLNYEKLYLSKFWILDMRFDELNEMLKSYECDSEQVYRFSYVDTKERLIVNKPVISDKVDLAECNDVFKDEKDSFAKDIKIKNSGNPCLLENSQFLKVDQKCKTFYDDKFPLLKDCFVSLHKILDENRNKNFTCKLCCLPKVSGSQSNFLQGTKPSEPPKIFKLKKIRNSKQYSGFPKAWQDCKVIVHRINFKNVRGKTYLTNVRLKCRKDCKEVASFIKKDQENQKDLYKCQICCKTFLNSGGLGMHKWVHKEKPYKCRVCGVGFFQKENLRTHLITIHINNNYF